MLKRKKPLKAKQGFKVKGGKLRPVSKSKSKVNEQYKAVRIKYLNDHPNCEACGCPACDIHHKRGRGKFLSDATTFMATCRECHIAIHHNPKWAREKGYLIYEYGSSVRDVGGGDGTQSNDLPGA